MKKVLICLFALVSVAQDIWAQTVYNVTTEAQLNNAIADGATNIVLGNNITLTNRVVIDAEVSLKRKALHVFIDAEHPYNNDINKRIT